MIFFPYPTQQQGEFMLIKKTTEPVSVEKKLNDQELAAAGLDLATAMNGKSDLLAESQRYIKDVKAKVAGFDAMIDSFLRIIESGRQWIKVDCRVMINPQTGKKVWVDDSGEILKEKPIPPEDLQGDLFSVME
jgi:hypothetical protein